MNCRAKALGITFLLIAIVPATLSWYGVVSLAAFLIISYTYTLIYLLRQLKAFPSENFESEIRSIKNQNYTFIFCLVLACIAIYLYVRADGDYTKDFKLEIIDLTLTCCFRIIWDLHFILVHRRVFGLTTFILRNHNESFLEHKSTLDRSTHITHQLDLSLGTEITETQTEKIKKTFSASLDASNVTDAHESSLLLELNRGTV